MEENRFQNLHIRELIATDKKTSMKHKYMNELIVQTALINYYLYIVHVSQILVKVFHLF